uniref:Zinc finger E-box-binding homeobox 1 n=1 Tax=Cyprinodon variegatus TaxID=28743 RepID=A0A3Q2CYA7_CYPVA
MADGPRCKRRKQANPRRTSVTNYNNVLEAGSESDDEDKLHIVEEEGSLADGADCDSTLPDDEHPGVPNGREDDFLKEDCASDGEDDVSTDALVEEMLQKGDTAIIYPEAPEDELQRQGTPDASVHDENGTPDSFSQLLTCPYCSRGYKRYSSLKEHIKYRHEKTEESFSCPECSYSFAYRAQLERHMREKPYECSHCKKRFSHSGSYSSHISSKKCISVISVNSRQRLGSSRNQAQGSSPGLPTSPSARCGQIREKMEHSRPLQEQLPLNQIKTEPVEYEYKPAVITPPAMATMNGGVFGGGAAAPLQGTVQAVVLPTVGLVSPISINLADLQNALKVAVDGNVIRQVLENNAKGQVNSGLTTGTLHPPQQQLISAISLPIVGQDGNAKLIINYSLDPNQGQLTPHNLKKEPLSPAQSATDSIKSQKLPEDLSVRGSRDQETKQKEEKTTKTCLLCENYKSEAVAALLSEGGLCNHPKNLLSLLKAYFALNAEPSKEELVKISDSVSLPVNVVKKWFDKMQQGQISLGAPTPPSEEEDSCEAHSVVSLVPGKDLAAISSSVSQDSPTEATPAEVNGAHSSPASPSPINLTAGCPAQADTPESTEGPLDLSLPKPARDEAESMVPPARVYPSASSCSTNEEEPLNLTCTKKDTLPLSAMGGSPLALYANQPSAKPLDIVATMQCLQALTTTNNNSKQTILIPQLAYTYTTTANSPAGTETHETIHLNGIKEERLDLGSEGFSALDEQNDSDSGPARKKMKKTDSGMYACDLCDKIFQKSSSLLRHKYEHTGKRPHECGICSKAFKHKHHLIEHMRLHSGEKPYQCDKCGKRFSHSGSYSQHMNHRYSYCKKEAQSQAGGRESPEEDGEGPADMQQQDTGPSLLDSDERGSSTREDEESEEEEEEGVVDMNDIQVVQIEEEEEEEEEKDGENGTLEKEEKEEADTRQVNVDPEEATDVEGGVTEEAGGEVREESRGETNRREDSQDEKETQKENAETD